MRPTVRSGHRATAPIRSGTAGCYKMIAAHSKFSSPRDSPQYVRVTTPLCNHSAIGHDPVSLSVLDPANKEFP
ncbi:hypothetical protein F2Q70_00011948 [Brassica cretica]|uniref:Uncharacterized protein n=1 Tax=Brassica cretica TaxID=69181 RepID=A0A3N6RUZ9_BRACR|nr:hypothetical protein F2Q70_00011948 [Brassica cretica]KAF3546953.1 hypothetical protein DY000_02007565 [Brassica cretica]